MDRANFSDLVGVTLKEIRGAEAGSESVRFFADDGREWQMWHSQDCCECVEVEDVSGDVSDLIGTPILSAEETSNRDDPKKDNWDDSWTWTFYRISTFKGTVVIRWYGSSNGYYSESVDFEEVHHG